MIPNDFDHWAYRIMYRIRIFEENLLDLFSQGKISGTTHTYIGQEANAVAVASCCKQTDTFFSNHRCHGHYIAKFENYLPLLKEILGRSDGVCSGKGGSQHVCDENFFSNGIQAGSLAISVGKALSNKLEKSNNIVVSFIGDGTMGEGNAYEAFNLASTIEVPLLIVLENNRYAQSTPVNPLHMKNFSTRFNGFNIENYEIDTNNVNQIREVVGKAVSHVRKNSKPVAVILNTYRLAAHSKGDDTRDQNEINSWWEKDPLRILRKKLPVKITTKIELEEKQKFEIEIQKFI